MNKFEFYIDGVSQGNLRTNTTLYFQNESDINIMCDNATASTGTSGSVDEIRIYDTNLSNDNIASLTNNHVISGSHIKQEM